MRRIKDVLRENCMSVCFEVFGKVWRILPVELAAQDIKEFNELLKDLVSMYNVKYRVGALTVVELPSV